MNRTPQEINEEIKALEGMQRYYLNLITIEQNSDNPNEEFMKNVANDMEKLNISLEETKTELKKVEEELDKKREEEKREENLKYGRLDKNLEGMKCLYKHYQYEAICNLERTKEEKTMFVKLANELKEKIFDYVIGNELYEDGIPFSL